LVFEGRISIVRYLQALRELHESQVHLLLLRLELGGLLLLVHHLCGRHDCEGAMVSAQNGWMCGRRTQH